MISETHEPRRTAGEPLPATVLIGFLGAGKTTLLNHLLSSQHGRRIAVIVNDFSEINIDSRLVRHTTDRLVEMSNGCICCTLREDLIDELRGIATLPEIEHIIIESTGIGEPLPIAQAFHMEDLPEQVRLMELVTVVDAANFWTDYERSDWIEDAEGNPVEAALAPLLIDQLEYTNVVLLNKTDLADPETIARLEGFIRSLNPEARIHRTVLGAVDPGEVFGTGLYTYEGAEEADGWDENWELDGAGEADEYGFNTFTYLSNQPFEETAFTTLLNDWPDQIMRAKGLISFDSGRIGLVSVVRDNLDIQYLDPLVEGEDPSDLGLGDTAIELVVIGQAMPVETIVARLDACLVGEN